MASSFFYNYINPVFTKARCRAGDANLVGPSVPGRGGWVAYNQCGGGLASANADELGCFHKKSLNFNGYEEVS
jgi:hypothetical protein